MGWTYLGLPVFYKKRQHARRVAFLVFVGVACLSAGLGIRSAAAAGAWTKFNRRADAKTISEKIHLDGLGFFVKGFFDDELKTVYIEYVVIFFGLIQSHCQRRTASATLVQEYPNRRNVLTLEIFGDLL